jgi:SAM-dependent methyltransferase
VTDAAGASGDPPDPAAVWGVVDGFTAYWAVVALLRLGVFEVLDGGGLELDALAAATGAAPHRLEPLCATARGRGLLVCDDGRWALTSTSATFLVRASSASMADLVERSPGPHAGWAALDGTAIAGPAEPVGPSFHATLVEATAPTQLAAAAATAAALGIGGSRRVGHVLDVATGAAPWASALLAADPDAVATCNDLPDVIGVAQRAVAARGLETRCRWLPGDIAHVPLPSADVVVVAHLLRAGSPTWARAVLRRAAAAVRPGGLLLVADYFLDDDHLGPPVSVRMGLTMVASTAEGRALVRSEVSEWMRGEGLAAVRPMRPVPFQEVLVAERPGVAGPVPDA